jgi:SAM-dependent methyltransferase
MTIAMDKPAGKALDADEYAARHDASLGFESVCIEARSQCNLRHLMRLAPLQVLEVGCGPVLLSERALPLLPGLKRWVVVEPAARYVEHVRTRLSAEPRVQVVQDYVEHLAASMLSGDGSPWADMILLSSVIHETTHPQELLEAALQHLRPGGHVLVNVPNAMSFHRLLATAMGLIAEPAEPGERNRRFGQPTVYTAASLRDLFASLRLRETSFEGYLFKPFTHAQMAGVMTELGEAGAQGLIELGRRFPEHAAEICIVAQRSA